MYYVVTPAFPAQRALPVLTRRRLDSADNQSASVRFSSDTRLLSVIVMGQRLTICLIVAKCSQICELAFRV